MSACDFLPLQLSVTIQELVPRVPPTIFVWFHPYVYFRSLVLGRLSLSASKYGRENLDRIFAGIENQTLNFMGKVPESAGFGKCRVLSHPASQPRIRGSFLFFSTLAASGSLRPLFAFGYLHVLLREALFASAKSALCTDDWVRWQRLSEAIICRVRWRAAL